MKQIKIKINDELNDSYPDGAYFKINGAFFYIEHYYDMDESEKDNEQMFMILFQRYRMSKDPELVTMMYDLDIASYCVKRFIDFGYTAYCRDIEDGKVMLLVSKPGIGTTEGRSV